LAIHQVDVLRPGSVLPTSSPAVPLPGTFVALQTETPAYVPFGGDRSGAPADFESARSWAPIAPTRWNTGGASALSATPLIGVVAGVGIAFAVTFSMWLALVIMLLPLQPCCG
jgi:hypothetical protein